MALVVKDRVRETSTTTGTGTITLNGAVTGFQSFLAIGDGNTTYYTIVDAATGNWEVGIGTYSAGVNTLTRTTVLESSNNGNLVDFAAGTKDVFCTYPAEKSVDSETAQTLTNKTLGSGTAISGGTINGATIGGSTAAAGSFTTLTTSSTVTHNGGTANGVAYLNGSKVLTTGSALTFDGANLGVGTSVPSQKLEVVSSSGGTTARLSNTNAGNFLDFFETNTSTRLGYVGTIDGTNWTIHNDKNGYIAFDTNNTERMRLTSTGLGIGTSSPGVKLDVAGVGRIGNGSLGAYFGTGSAFANEAEVYSINTNPLNIGTTGTAPLRFWTNSSERMRIDSSGNVGIGTSAPASKLDILSSENNLRVQINTLFASAGNTAIQLGGYPGFPSNSGATIRTYHNHGATTASSLAFEVNGTFEAMRITDSGNVGIGTSSPSYKLQVTQDGNLNATSAITNATAGTSSVARFLAISDAGNAAFGMTSSSYTDITGTADSLLIGAGNASGGMSFALDGFLKMKLDSSGNLGLGVTPSAWASGSKAIQVNLFASLSCQADGAANFGFNFYEGGANTFNYVTTDEACRFSALTTGGFGWFTAPSGTAGNAISFTQAMTLHASGGLSIGNTTDPGAANLSVKGTINGGYVAHATGTTAMAFGSYKVVRVTPNATATYTTTVPPAGATCTLSILTSGTTSYTITFGTGFKTTGTLATGTTSARYFQISFVSDGTNLLETGRTTAIA